MKSTQTVLTNPLITPEHVRRKALIYIRQSSIEQVEKNTGSQAFQRNQFELARAYGWPDDLIEFIDEDLGKSGSSVDRRTGWHRMLDQIAANAVGCIFAVNISRLGRELRAIEDLRILAQYHGTLLCLDNRFSDPNNPNDTVLTQMTATFAEYENKKRAEHSARSRMAKARQGEVVSALPVGWREGEDGKYDFDPAVKETIRTIIDAFMQVRSIRGTVKKLAKAGVKVPSRCGKTLNWSKPSSQNVHRIMTNPAYVGTYVYGKTESQIGGPVRANGWSSRVNVPEHQWVKRPNHHPAYMSQEQQEEIKVILRNNDFYRRHRAGRGPALTQGLLRCAECKRMLGVFYSRYKSYRYVCVWDTEACTRFNSSEFDKQILAEVFKVLETPPLEMLRAALEDTRRRERTRLNWIESERARLEHEERKARERMERTHRSYRRVYRDAEEKFEKVLQEKEEFELKIAPERSLPKNDQSEKELEELCRIASDVPRLWHHAEVTDQERKEILRCIIDHILVRATKETIDGTIFWKSGGQTPLKTIWRGVGRHQFIRELHAQKLTALEIKEHLAAGKTSSGQTVKLSVCWIYRILHKLGLKPNRYSAGYFSVQKKAAELYREGRSIAWIARDFNEQGVASASGKPWTSYRVGGLLHTIGEKPASSDNVHRSTTRAARLCGLNKERAAVRNNLIRELHAQKLTALEIQEYLAAGKTSSGQAVKLPTRTIYWILKKMGLKPHPFSLSYLSLRRKTAELKRGAILSSGLRDTLTNKGSPARRENRGLAR